MRLAVASRKSEPLRGGAPEAFDVTLVTLQGTGAGAGATKALIGAANTVVGDAAPVRVPDTLAVEVTAVTSWSTHGAPGAPVWAKSSKSPVIEVVTTAGTGVASTTGSLVAVLGWVAAVTSLAAPLRRGPASPASQARGITSTSLARVRPATTAPDPLTWTLARPLAKVTPVSADRSVATSGRQAPA